MDKLYKDDQNDHKFLDNGQPNTCYRRNRAVPLKTNGPFPAKRPKVVLLLCSRGHRFLGLFSAPLCVKRGDPQFLERSNGFLGGSIPEIGSTVEMGTSKEGGKRESKFSKKIKTFWNSTLPYNNKSYGPSTMSEFIGSADDSNGANTNPIYPSQVAKRPRHTDSTLTTEYTPLLSSPKQQYLSNSQYHGPISENPPSSRDVAEVDRPGTPALVVQAKSTTEVRARSVLQDDFQPTGYHRFNYAVDRRYRDAACRDSSRAYPPTVAPPSSPSRFYTLLLQRNFRPPECPTRELWPQSPISHHSEWDSMNTFHPRIPQQTDYYRGYQERAERSFYARQYGTIRPRYEQYEHFSQRPFLNQNYNRLPYSMVRIQNTNDDDDEPESCSMNGFTEDGEGNHECHDLRHSSIPALEDSYAPVDDFHQNRGRQIGGSDLTKQNGVPNLGTIYQGEWPMHRALWMSGPSSIGEKDPLDGFGGDDTESIMSFSSSTATMGARRPHAHQLGTKMEMVYSLLSMLGSCNREDMSRTLLEMSNNQDSCIAMRQSGCLPLLIQLLHGSEPNQPITEAQSSSENVTWAVREARRRASQALHNIVHAHPDDRRGRREARVLRLLEQIRDYSDFLRDLGSSEMVFSHNENLDLHPGPAIAALMKLSFDEEHRHAMCQLGGLQAIAELIQADHEIHGNTSDQFCVTVRRYAGMALTNLTFGDGNNKALLCSMKPFMQALVAQLHSPNEDLRQVTASVLRNLSWRADTSSKEILREVGVVVTLMKAAMEAQKESTLKSILSALWNLSAHCSMNKGDICEVEGALEFLVSTLTYKSSANTVAIIENGGGILRNVSSHIAVREDYRAILRRHKCLQTLLSHLKSPSLTVVSNACGTLWNLSARCAVDQKSLWEMGAVGMLRNLIHSKHKMISMGSSAALKNLLAARPEGMTIGLTSSFTESNGGLSNMPSLLVRKQKALAADIDQNLAETCDNIDSPKASPTPNGDCKKFSYETNGFNGLDRKPQFLSYLPGRMYHSINGQVGSPVRVPRSESKDSLGSTRSEPPHYKAQRERFKVLVNNNRTMPLDSRTIEEKAGEWKERTNLPFEGNSNVVLQMFRHLQNTNGSSSSGVPDVKTNGHTELSDGEEKPAIRPTTLPPPRKGSLGRNNRFYERKSVLNNFHHSQKENGYGLSSSKGYAAAVAMEPDMDDLDALLEIPGNKRTLEDSRNSYIISSEKKQVHNLSSEAKNIDNIGPEIKYKNVVLRKKKPVDALSSSFSRISKDVSDDGTDQTPLVVSRCSSLSSLTSCFQNSARSSWVSDVSQRTSAIISPTDLPESPGYSTADEKHRIFEFTDKIPDAEVHSLIRPRPAWPMGSLPSSDSLPSSVKRMSLDSDVFTNSHETDVKSEGVFGSPAAPSRPQNSPISPKQDQYSNQESPSSQEETNRSNNHNQDHELLAACILMGKPAPPQPLNTSILHSRLGNVQSSDSPPRSGIPIKSRMAQSFPAAVPTSTDQKLSSSFCDDNDNVLESSGNAESSVQKTSGDVDGTEPVKAVSQAFLSKCLSVCKKYPALSHKSSFEQGKLKTAIPQIVRSENPNFDNEQHPKQLHIKSQSLPVYKGITSSSSQINRDSLPKPTAAQGHSSSTEENVSEDNILSSSPSACDESEGMDSDEKARLPHGSSYDLILRSNRVRSRKTKANRRSMEIRVPSEQSSEDDNKNNFPAALPLGSSSVSHIVSVPSSESEEKVKEDARTREKVSRGIIPDLLEGAAIHDNTDRRAQGGCIAKATFSWNSCMTDSMELRRGALLIAAELEEGMEDFTHSSTSIDLEHMKPPSCMAEMSMTSSGLSDLLSTGNGCYINGKRAVDRRRNIKRSKKIGSGHRFVLKSVRQTIAKNLDASRHLDRPISASTSLENVSLKSSGTSDLIENINPPSMLEDLSMTNSCASLNSISSDILESRSNSLADPRSNSEMFQRLNAAAAMVQVYSREFSNIMTGSMKSSYNSDCLDLVKPPSIFHDIAEVTVEDGTEILSDPLVSDFELEEELPHDDEPSVPSAETIHSPFLPPTTHLEDSAENLNSSFDGDSLVDREHFPNKRVSALALEHRNPSSADDDMSSGFFSNLTTDDHCSIEKDDSSIPSPSPPIVRQGPRIVKPINRETVRQMQEKKNAEKSATGIRGKAPARNLLQQVTSARVTKSFTKTPSPSVTGVRQTRASALRASQNKQPNIKTSGGRMSPRSFLSKPPAAPKVNKPISQSTPKITTDAKTSRSSETKRPSPPVKQNTFVKDETVPKVPNADPDQQSNDDKGCAHKVMSPVASESKCVNRKLSFSPASPSSDMSLQRKYSAPTQKRSGIPTSPSSQSIPDDRTFKQIQNKKSPSNGNISGLRTAPPVASNRTTSTHSLSSQSSSSKSATKQKDVSRKISSLWRRSESSSSSANSPGTDSSGDKQLPGGAKRKLNGAKDVSNRPAPSTTQQTGITRSSTYEKLSKASNPTSSSKPQARGPSTNTGASFKSRKPITSITKTTKKNQPAKPSGGPRIVKPVPKPNAITSRTLRQSGSFCPPSFSISSGPPACISNGRNYQDSTVSIPLVTGPFDSTSFDNSDAQSRNVTRKNRSDSDSESVGSR
ncbi:hypothetical protein JTE90_001412 [Oedothorax gibbosus]|uniref:Adenomatous polyposis coli protein n=1 Tax=Oedothorax gibbosus TaxID=931172 RepID=A0AAV6VFG0_9ARAC|nr:hypothetical protein JTE90_001412 [Oedothorax gibbosus]